MAVSRVCQPYCWDDWPAENRANKDKHLDQSQLPLMDAPYGCLFFFWSVGKLKLTVSVKLHDSHALRTVEDVMFTARIHEVEIKSNGILGCYWGSVEEEYKREKKSHDT
jgi:hypothetical protein